MCMFRAEGGLGSSLRVEGGTEGSFGFSVSAPAASPRYNRPRDRIGQLSPREFISMRFAITQFLWNHVKNGGSGCWHAMGRGPCLLYAKVQLFVRNSFLVVLVQKNQQLVQKNQHC